MSQKGFTLIELVIVSAVFLFVIGGATIIFISMINHQRNILKEHEFLNQISYVEEYMSKALRMAKTATDDDLPCIESGQIYQLTKPGEGFYRGVKFINQSDNNTCQEFYWDTNEGVLREIKNNGNPVDITSASLEIIDVRFGINGGNGCFGGETCASWADSAGMQPRITILLTAKIDSPDQQPTRIIQTTVSQRNLNP